MSVKKDPTTSTHHWCFLMQLFKWEPVVYTRFHDAHALMLDYMLLEGCTPSLTGFKILHELIRNKECTVYGMRNGHKTDITVIFKRLPLVIGTPL